MMEKWTWRTKIRYWWHRLKNRLTGQHSFYVLTETTFIPFFAWGDGVHDDSENLKFAVRVASEAGGGTIFVGKGRFKI